MFVQPLEGRLGADKQECLCTCWMRGVGQCTHVDSTWHVAMCLAKWSSTESNRVIAAAQARTSMLAKVTALWSATLFSGTMLGTLIAP